MAVKDENLNINISAETSVAQKALQALERSFSQINQTITKVTIAAGAVGAGVALFKLQDSFSKTTASSILLEKAISSLNQVLLPKPIAIMAQTLDALFPKIDRFNQYLMISDSAVLRLLASIVKLAATISTGLTRGVAEGFGKTLESEIRHLGLAFKDLIYGTNESQKSMLSLLQVPVEDFAKGAAIAGASGAATWGAYKIATSSTTKTLIALNTAVTDTTLTAISLEEAFSQVNVSMMPTHFKLLSQILYKVNPSLNLFVKYLMTSDSAATRLAASLIKVATIINTGLNEGISEGFGTKLEDQLKVVEATFGDLVNGTNETQQSFIGLETKAIGTILALSASSVAAKPQIQSFLTTLDSGNLVLKNFASATPLPISHLKNLGESLKNSGLAASKFLSTLAKPSSNFLIFKGLSIFLPLLDLFSSKLENSENKVLQFSGNVIQAVALITAGLTAAVNIVAHVASEVSQQLGNAIFDTFTDFSKLTVKAQSDLNALSFVLSGFSRELGPNFVGSFSQWEEVIKKFSTKSTASTQEFYESIKLLVAEGSRLGLNFETNVMALDTALQLSAVSGKNLTEVTQALLSGITGNAQAVLSLGLDLRESAVLHSKLAEQAKITSLDIGDTAAAALKLGVVFEQSTPIMGAAENKLNTIAGASQLVANKMDLVKIKLGSVSFFTDAFNKTMTKALDIIVSLPEPLFSTIGQLADLAGAILLVGGKLLGLSVIFGTAAAAFGLLNNFIVSSLALQTLLSSAFLKIGAALGTVTGPITSAVTLFSSMLKVSTALFLTIVKNGFLAMGSLLKFVTLLSLKLAPWVALIAAAVFVINNLIASVQEIVGKLHIFQMITASITEALETVTKKFKEVFGVVDQGSSSVLPRFFSVVKSISNILVSGVAAAAVSAAVGFLRLKQSLLDSSEESEQTEKSIQKLYADLESLKNIAAESAINVLDLGTRVALAAEDTDKAEKKFSILEDVLKKMDKSAKETTSSLSDLQQKLKSIEKFKTPNQSIAAGITANYQSELEAIDQLAAKLSSADLKKVSADLKAGRQLLADNAANELATEQLKALDEVLAKTNELKAATLPTSGNTFIDLMDKQLVELAQKAEKIQKDGLLTADVGSAIGDQEKTIISSAQMNILDEYAKKTADINNEIAAAKLSENEKIQAGLDLELKKISALKEELSLRGKLTPELEKQLQDTKVALTAKAKADTDTKLSASPELLSQLQGFSTSMTGGVGAYVAAAQEVVDAGPNLLNSIADLFNSIENLPMALADAFGRVVDNFLSLLYNFPTLFIQAISKIKDVIVKLIKELPNAINSLVLAIPEMLASIVEALPDILTQYISSFISSFPKQIVNAFKLVFVQLPKLIMSVLSTIVVDLPIAIYDGIKAGLSEIKALFFGSDFINVDSAKAKLTEYAQTFASSASSIFEVTDLAIASKASDSAVKDVLEAAKNAEGMLIDAWNWVIENVWSPLKNAVSTAFSWVVTNILEPMDDFIQAAFSWIVKNIWDPLASVVSSAFEWVKKNVWDPIAGVVQAAFSWIVKNIWDPLASVVSSAFEWVKKNVWDPIAGVIYNAFKPIIDLLSTVFDPVFKVFTAIFDSVKDTIIRPIAKLLGIDIDKKPKKEYGPTITIQPGTVAIPTSVNNDQYYDPKTIQKPSIQVVNEPSYGYNSMGLPNFASGGFVGGMAKVAGDSILNDRVLAALSPGEAVISREMLQRPGVSEAVNQILSGGQILQFNRGGAVGLNNSYHPSPGGIFKNSSPQPQNNITINITNNASETIDDSYVTRRIIPKIKQELKTASLQGQYIISSKGVY